MTLVVGIDGCKGGWVGVALEGAGFAGAATAAEIGALVGRLQGAAAAGVLETRIVCAGRTRSGFRGGGRRGSPG